ncbi:M23 family metallopeptidase [Kribbella voronezhensis]|nr:M23 family metallopeptidase [Kribbella voronezhensis]
MKPTQQTPARRTHLPAASVSRAAARRGALLAATLSAFAAVALALALPPPATAAPPGAEPSPAVWPLTPRPEIVRGFELPAKPWLPGHRGLDLSGSPGQPVLSATKGTITYAGPLAGRGVVVVTNGPLRTTYEPVIASTHVGATVAPGDQLGTLSSAGTHCPPRTCLHWGLRRAATYLNPLTLLTASPVRLLPLAPPPTTGHLLSTNSSTSTAEPQANDPLDPRTSPPVLSPDRDPEPGFHHDSGRGSGDASTPGSLRGSGLAPAVVVGLSAALTLAGGLLIRRH